MDARFITSLVLAAVLIVTPGPDMALVARNAVKGGYPTAAGMGGTFVQGLVGNVLNPKAGAIFVAVVPQFIVGLGVRVAVERR